MKIKQRAYKTGKLALSAGVVFGAAMQSGIMEMMTARANTITIKSDESNPQYNKQYVIYKLLDSQGSKESGILYSVPGGSASIKASNLEKLKAAIKAVDPSVSDQAINTEAKTIGYISNFIESGPDGTTDSFGNAGVETDAPSGKYRQFLEALVQLDLASFPSEEVNVGGADPIGLPGTSVYHAIENGTKVEISKPGRSREGYYLIVETNHPGEKDQSTSLVMAMHISEDEDVTVNLKSDRPEVIKKVEEDTEIGWNDIADFEIGQDFKYEFISEVPNMNAYRTYYFDFEDEMDPDIALDVNSTADTDDAGREMKITIGSAVYSTAAADAARAIEYQDGSGTTHNAGAPWKLEKTGAGFKVICQDLKALGSADGFTAGDAIKLQYHAHIVDDASLVGRQSAFENTVKINYSNNPRAGGEGERGQSPEDTVVVYTYGIDINKINDQAAPERLEGAEFELKRTDGSTVYVKDNGDGTYTIDNSIKADTQGFTKMLRTQGAGGKFVIYGVDAETYTLKETKAPDNYSSLNGTITLTLSASMQEDRAADEKLHDPTPGYVRGTGGTSGDTASGLTGLELTAASYQKDLNDPIDLDAGSVSAPWYVQDNGNKVDPDVQEDAFDGVVAATVVNKKNSALAFTGGQSLIALTVTLAAGGLYVVARRKRLESESE